MSGRVYGKHGNNTHDWLSLLFWINKRTSAKLNSGFAMAEKNTSKFELNKWKT